MAGNCDPDGETLAAVRRHLNEGAAKTGFIGRGLDRAGLQVGSASYNFKPDMDHDYQLDQKRGTPSLAEPRSYALSPRAPCPLMLAGCVCGGAAKDKATKEKHELPAVEGLEKKQQTCESPLLGIFWDYASL